MPLDPHKIPWQTLSELMSRDPARRGLAGLSCPPENPRDAELHAAAVTLSAAKKVGIVTGFCIADIPQPAAETDGPPGAVYLAHALAELGIDPLLISDAFGTPLLEACCDARGLPREWIVPFPFEPLGARERNAPQLSQTTDAWIEQFSAGRGAGITHLVAIERCGPSHTLASIRAQGGDPATIAEFERTVPPASRDACHNMRGIDITPFTAKTHRLFEHYANVPGVTAIGIGDGGNELGMGCIPWSLLKGAIPFGPGEKIACRIAADRLLVCGVSNWGGYALALAATALQGKTAALAGVEDERAVIEQMVRQTGAVDGVTRRREATVDGLPLETYLQILTGMLRALDSPA